MLHRKYRFSCEKSGDGCDFALGGLICGVKITDEIMSRMLETGSSGLIRGFTSKSGKKFDAELRLIEGRLKFEFPRAKPDTAPPPSNEE